MKLRVFISYSSSDGTNFANKAAEIIRKTGHQPWIYYHNKTLGVLVWQEIAKRIVNETDVFIFLCTPLSCHSWGQAQEAGYALNHRKKTITIVIDNAQVPLELTARNYANTSSGQYLDTVKEIALDLPRIIKRIQKLNPQIEATIL
ncbi:toll/interleukin-1 receptor domain-containing protein [Dehalogenimonas sp. 4OHTPN]|uniref:Toll/interleukin-1 receptor domain-containing protein n=1 Tax=Dehalogenimonas sp. 4OHTPN TaxID=3166643 RepID=A0AAU8G8Y1_9CHLR